MAPQNSSRDEDNFQARPSQRLGRNAPGVAQADGSTWQEYIAVCEVQEKLQVRSYFQNLTTGKRVWDEPPSGASNIIPASEEMRRMAALQLDELYVATTGDGDGGEGSSTNNTNANKSDNMKKKKPGLKSLFGMGRNKSTDSSSTSTNSNNKKIQYKAGSSLLVSGGSSGGVDPHLQAAIAQSIAESQGIPSSAAARNNGVAAAATHQQSEVDPDLAIAMALSLSDTTAAQHHTSNEEEEEMIRQALAASKLESSSSPSNSKRQTGSKRRSR